MRRTRTRALRAGAGLTVASLALSVAVLPGTSMAAAADSPASAQPVPAQPAPAPVDGLVVRTSDGRAPTRTTLAQLASIAGDPVATGRAIGGGFYAISLSNGLTLAQATAVATTADQELPALTSVTPDVRIRPADVFPGRGDALSGQQWDLWDSGGVAGGFSVRAPAAWPSGEGASQVVVAVIDTGITSHPDLDGGLVAGYDFISDPASSNDDDGWDPDPTDMGDFSMLCSGSSSWHGTHVTGTIVATHDGDGTVGVAAGARVQMVRVLGSCGGSLSDLAAAIRWAAGGDVGVPPNPTPAKVISMSLAADMMCPAVLVSAIRYAVARDVAVVAAAGNEAADVAGSTPANCPGVIAVAATGRDGQRASYSNFGTQVAIAAPGGSDGQKVLSTSNDGSTLPGAPSYRYMMGTSMATPHVAGALALVRSARPDWTASQAWAAVAGNARAFPEGTIRDCTTRTCGVGLLDLVGLLPDPPGWFALTGEVLRGGIATKGVDVAAIAQPDLATYYGHTDASGSYRVAVPAGKYRLRFTQGATVSTTGDITVSGPISLPTVGWPDHGSLTGTVINAADRRPIAGVEVGLASLKSATVFRTASTDASGVFRLSGIPAGSYRVRVTGSAIVTGWIGGPDYNSATIHAVSDGVVSVVEFPVSRTAAVAPVSTVAPAATGAGPAPAEPPTRVEPAPGAIPAAAPVPIPVLAAALGAKLLPGTPPVRITPATLVTLMASVPAGTVGTVQFADSAGVLGQAPIIGSTAVLRTRLRGGRQAVVARVLATAPGPDSTALQLRVADRLAPQLKVRWKSRSQGMLAVRATDLGGVARLAIRWRSRSGNWSQWSGLTPDATRWDAPSWAKGSCVGVRATDWAGNRASAQRCW